MSTKHSRTGRSVDSPGEAPVSPQEKFMRLALLEAQKGLGRTSPNPAVGALLVKDGRVIARGHHAIAGGPHAEAVALKKAGARAEGADLYTTLEPCDHFGRTPPCSQAILNAGVKRVFIGSRDPNPLVNGRGIARLRAAGMEVSLDVLRRECESLNSHWFTYITENRPHVTLKAATTLDGRIATRTGDSRWVTGPLARERVHQIRNQVDGVLIGSGTARKDDPRLTTRIPGGRDPVRIVLDTNLSLPGSLKLFKMKSSAKTIVAHSSNKKRSFRRGVELLFCDREKDGVSLRDLLEKLGRRGITSLLVEGGGHVHARFLAEKLVDRVAIFIAPKILGADGIPVVAGKGPSKMADALSFCDLQIERLGEDLLLSGVPKRNVRRRLAKRPRGG